MSIAGERLIQLEEQGALIKLHTVRTEASNATGSDIT